MILFRLLAADKKTRLDRKMNKDYSTTFSFHDYVLGNVVCTRMAGWKSLLKLEAATSLPSRFRTRRLSSAAPRPIITSHHDRHHIKKQHFEYPENDGKRQAQGQRYAPLQFIVVVVFGQLTTNQRTRLPRDVPSAVQLLRKTAMRLRASTLARKILGAKRASMSTFRWTADSWLHHIGHPRN